MSLCEQEEWKLYCAFKHSWKINLQDENTLSSTFKSHNGNYKWWLCLEPKFQGINCANCVSKISPTRYCIGCDEDIDIHICSKIPAQTDNFLNYCLQVSLQEFASIYPNNLEKKKMDIQIFNANNVDDSIKREVWIDKEKTTFTINFSQLEAEKLFLNNKDSDLTIVVRIFDIINQSKDGTGFEKLLKSGECSDFKIIVDKKEFLVHKCILATKSNYFSAMFKHDTKENVECVVNISDIKVEVIHELLKFIYGVKVDLKDDLLFDLLIAANLYYLKDLTTICEKRIVSNLTVGNLGDCIEYADKYNNEYLKKETIQFIIKDGSKFSDDDVNHLNARLTSVSSSYLASLVCSLLKNLVISVS